MIRSSLESKLYILHRAATLEKSHPRSSSAGSTRFAPSKVLYGAVLAALIAVLLLVYRTRGSSFRWDLLESTIKHADWRWVTASIFLTLLTVVGRALRWQVMLRPFGRTLGVAKLTSDTAIGLAAAVFLGRAGEVIRPYLIATQAGLPFSSQAAAWLLERVLDLVAVLLICAYALTRLSAIDPGVHKALIAGGYSLALGAVLASFLLIAFLDPAQRAQRRILSALTFLPEHAHERAVRMLGAFTQGVQSMRDPGSLILLICYTWLEWTIIASGVFTMLHAFPGAAGLGASDILILLAFSALGSLIQIPGVGGGMQAAMIVALTKVYGLPVEAATGMAFALWLVGTIVTVAFGLACAFHQGLNWSKLKLLSTKQILDTDA
jgi:glycosyltransferase 2 family protein